MAAAQPLFALHPTDAIQGIIDLTMHEGVKLYQTATSSFYMDPADYFNCEAPGLHGFLKEVEGRASRFGWCDVILEIPNDIANPLGGTRNLLTHYGELSLAHLREWETTYIHGMSRAAQDTAHLYLCLMNSLTQAGKDKVTYGLTHLSSMGASPGSSFSRSSYGKVILTPMPPRTRSGHS